MIDEACKILGKAKQAVTPTTLVAGMKSTYKIYSLVLQNYISLLIKWVTLYGLFKAQFYSYQQFANHLKANE